MNVMRVALCMSSYVKIDVFCKFLRRIPSVMLNVFVTVYKKFDEIVHLILIY